MTNGIIIAITGQSGCGKSTLSSFYASKGYMVIDCDTVAKEVREKEDCKFAIANAFGNDVLKDGVIDKKLLAEKAFMSDENLKLLTDITHPYIISEILSKANQAFGNDSKFVFVDGAVIIGHDFEQYCDEFIVVVVSEQKRCERLMKRDGISFNEAKNRILKQTPYSNMLEKADYVVNNNKDMQSLLIQGELVLKEIEKQGGI